MPSDVHYVNRVVFKKMWWEAYTLWPKEGRGETHKFHTAQEAYTAAVAMCDRGFNDPPRVEVRIDQVTRESRIIDTPDFIQEAVMERLDIPS